MSLSDLCSFGVSSSQIVRGTLAECFDGMRNLVVNEFDKDNKRMQLTISDKGLLGAKPSITECAHLYD